MGLKMEVFIPDDTHRQEDARGVIERSWYKLRIGYPGEVHFTTGNSEVLCLKDCPLIGFIDDYFDAVDKVLSGDARVCMPDFYGEYHLVFTKIAVNAIRIEEEFHHIGFTVAIEEVITASGQLATTFPQVFEATFPEIRRRADWLNVTAQWHARLNSCRRAQ